jgi:hypothetical protein
MARAIVRLNGDGIEDLLRSQGVTDDLMERGDRVAQQAKALAPVATGAYRAGIKAESDDHPDRSVVHVGSGVPYAAIIEARLRVLGRAIDAARG